MIWDDVSRRVARGLKRLRRASSLLTWPIRFTRRTIRSMRSPTRPSRRWPLTSCRNSKPSPESHHQTWRRRDRAQRVGGRRSWRRRRRFDHDHLFRSGDDTRRGHRAATVVCAAGVVALTQADVAISQQRPAEFDEPPTRANDPALTPTVEGITDQDSIDDWDPPFPFDGVACGRPTTNIGITIARTPKAFVSLAPAGRCGPVDLGRRPAFASGASAIDPTQLAPRRRNSAAPSKKTSVLYFVP